MSNQLSNGDLAYEWIKELFPICRSLTGAGVRQTLSFIQKICPTLIIHSVPSGTSAADWTIPKEWTIRDAYIKDQRGNKVVDFNNSNLHVLGYSSPIDKTISREDLENHLYSLPKLPHAILFKANSYTLPSDSFAIKESMKFITVL